ncbi:hypothetical protein SAMN05444484_1171, partial [Flavobacterium chilense]
MTTNPIDFRKVAKLVQENTQRKAILQQRINISTTEKSCRTSWGLMYMTIVHAIMTLHLV